MGVLNHHPRCLTPAGTAGSAVVLVRGTSYIGCRPTYDNDSGYGGPNKARAECGVQLHPRDPSAPQSRCHSSASWYLVEGVARMPRRIFMSGDVCSDVTCITVGMMNSKV